MLKINGTTYETNGIYGVSADIRGEKRECLKIVLPSMTYAVASSVFTDGISIVIVSGDVDESGNPIEYDQSEYSVAGDIVDTRDGGIIVYMGKRTQKEKLIALVISGTLTAAQYEAITGEAYTPAE